MKKGDQVKARPGYSWSGPDTGVVLSVNLFRGQAKVDWGKGVKAVSAMHYLEVVDNDNQEAQA